MNEETIYFLKGIIKLPLWILAFLWAIFLLVFVVPFIKLGRSTNQRGWYYDGWVTDFLDWVRRL